MIGTRDYVVDHGDVRAGGVYCAALVEEVADGAPGVEHHDGLAAEAEAQDGRGVVFGPFCEGEERLLEGKLVEVPEEEQRLWAWREGKGVRRTSGEVDQDRAE